VFVSHFMPTGITAGQAPRNLAFGPGDIVYGSHPGTPAFELQVDTESATPSVSVLRTFTGSHLPIRLGPMAYGTAEDIVVGLRSESFGSPASSGAHHVYAYRRSHLSTSWTVTPLALTQLTLENPNGNGVGEILMVGNRIFALATNNGLTALDLVEAAPPPPPPPPVAGALLFSNINDLRLANSDGTEPRTIVSALNRPIGVDVDLAAGHLYYAADGSGTIVRMNFDGSDPQVIHTVANPQFLKLHGGRIYWTQFSAGLFSSKLDGSDVQHLADLPLRQTAGLAIDATRGVAYFASANIGPDGSAGSGTLFRVDLDGQNLTTIGALPTNTYGIAVNSATNTLYGASFTGHRIYSLDLAAPGVAVDLVNQGLNGPLGVALSNDGTKIFWVERNGDATGVNAVGRVSSADANGSNVQVLRTTERSPFGIAVVPEISAPAEGFAEWIAQQGVPANQRGPQDDPDGDGIPNLLEYALGGNAGIPGVDVLPVAGFESIDGNTYLSLAVSRNESAQGVDLVVEVSGDLLTWDSGPAHTTVLEESAVELWVRDNTPVTEATRRFIRVRAVQQ
jgi:hypothetical protein